MQPYLAMEREAMYERMSCFRAGGGSQLEARVHENRFAGGAFLAPHDSAAQSGLRSSKSKAKNKIELGGDLNTPVKCKTEFALRVYECNSGKDGCDCYTTVEKKKTRRLLIVKATHKLASASSKACEPWFIHADAMIRNQVANFRKSAVKAKAATCQK